MAGHPRYTTRMLCEECNIDIVCSRELILIPVSDRWFWSWSEIRNNTALELKLAIHHVDFLRSWSHLMLNKSERFDRIWAQRIFFHLYAYLPSLQPIVEKDKKLQFALVARKCIIISRLVVWRFRSRTCTGVRIPITTR